MINALLVGMSKVKNIAKVPRDEQKKFIESFDTILFDLDGVIWTFFDPIPGAVECISKLKKIGKQIHYVTNNTTKSGESLLQRLNENKFNAELSDVVHPVQIVIGVLKKAKVNGDIYLMGMDNMKNELKMQGFTLVPDPILDSFFEPATIEERVAAVLAHYDDERKVGAVILDLDFNMSYIKIQKAFWYLRNNPECIFIVTLRDKFAPLGPKGPVIGMYHFIEALVEISGRDYIEAGKPSMTMVNHIKETYNITEPNRVLFVGDSIQSDLSTATKGNFQKLLVLSGTDKIEDINNWKYPEEYKPEYYAQDLSVLNDIIKDIYE